MNGREVREGMNDAAMMRLFRFVECDRCNNRNGFVENAFAAAYIFLLAKRAEVMDINDIVAFIQNQHLEAAQKTYLLNLFSELKHWQEYSSFITSFSEEQLIRFLLTNLDESGSKIISTPDQVVDLILQIMSPSPNMSIADFGTGFGDFLISAGKKYPQATLWGCDINTMYQTITSIRTSFLENEVEILNKNILKTKDDGRKFDRIYCFPSFGMRMADTREIYQDYLKPALWSLPFLKNTVSVEWVFAVRAYMALEASGKAVVVMPSGALVNSSDAEIRKYFIERKLIESIITLPERTFNNTGVSVSLVVISKNNDEAIKMIDASEYGIRERRMTKFSDQDIYNIIAAYNGETSVISENVSLGKIMKSGCVLLPKRYLEGNSILPYEAKFGDVVKGLRRGIALGAKELDSLISEAPTRCQYLTVSNIKTGVIDENPTYLKEIPSNAERYCVKENDLIISKVGKPFRVALASDIKDTVIANCNLFIISIDEKVADPHYIKAFLESETGVASLNGAAVGSAMPNLTKESLLNMSISLPPFEVQKRLGNLYRMELDKISNLRRELAEAEKNLSQLLKKNDFIQ